MVLILSNEEVKEALDPKGYVDAMEEAFTELGANAAVNCPRTETCIPLTKFGTSRRVKSEARALLRQLPEDADPHYSPPVIRAAKKSEELIYRLKTMPGGYPKCGVMALRIDSTTDTQPHVNGVKRLVKVPLGPGWNYTGIVILFSIKTGEVLALFPDGQIQGMRVGATSAVGVKYLSRREATKVGLIGTGWQAGGLLATVSQVRSLKRVQVFSPDWKRRREFASNLEKQIGFEVVAVDHVRDAFKGVDMVLCATSSRAPVFEAKWLKDGMHLGTINVCEGDPRAFRRCDSVVVNVRPFGGSSLIHQFVMGGTKADTVGKEVNRKALNFDWDRTTELGELLAAKRKWRRRPSDVTYHFNNIGLGIQFAAAGARILNNARAKGLGREVPVEWFVQKEHP